MQYEEIKNASAFELVERAIEIFDETSDVEREIQKSLFLTRAAEVGNLEAVKRIITKLTSADNRLKKEIEDEQKALNTFHAPVQVDTDRRGVAFQTIENILKIMRNDSHYAGVKYNVLRNCAEVDDGKSTRKWSDTDTAESMRYIENRYSIYSTDKHNSALKILFAEREYNPIMDVIDTVKWDGVERCEMFLSKYMQADDTPYVHEVSRLIFAGGIWRLMMPGCKFDEVPILIGAQGTGKSSICRFLAIHDDFFGEVKSMSGNQSIEQLQGKWICEIQELSAMTKAKEVEEVKSYITRQRDQYRKPYDRESSELPRRCIFIGTSNARAPLIDKTGNRRFFPVVCKLTDRYSIADKEQEIRDYALQCWAEALAKYKDGKMPNFAKPELAAEYKKAQDDAMQDDWRVGAIGKYLSECEVGRLVCARELAHCALSPDPEHPRDPSLKDSKEIGEMMALFPNWEREAKSTRTANYGVQRVWRKISMETDVFSVSERATMAAEDLPF